MRRAERLLPPLLLAPSVIFLLVFFAWPLVEALLVAFGDGAGGFSLGNFRQMADELNFPDALRNTLLLVAVAVPLQLVMAIGMAQLLGKLDRGRDLYLYCLDHPAGDLGPRRRHPLAVDPRRARLPQQRPCMRSG